MTSPTVRVSAVVRRTTAEGPGTRWAVWVQGCSVGCPGCCNPQTWRRDAGFAATVDDLAADALGAGVEGVTLLGGEPFDQAPALAVLAAAVRSGGLGVMAFTGYTLERLRSGSRAGWTDLLRHVDLLVDGPFLADRPDATRPWVGSTNQRFLHLTDRYRSWSFSEPDRVEIRVRRDGSVIVNGTPHQAIVDAVTAATLEDLL